MIIAVTVGIVIGTVNSKDEKQEINVLPIVIPVALASVGFGLYRGANRQKALFESYTLTITNNLITREQLNTPTISFYFNEIKEITKHKNGSFSIKGKGAGDLIVVPAQIGNYPQLETSLEQIMPIVAENKAPFLQRYQSVPALVSIVLMLCVYTINNKIIVALAGSGLIAFILWSVFKIRGNKNVDNKTKNSLWWLLVVLSSVIGVMIVKLTGIMHA